MTITNNHTGATILILRVNDVETPPGVHHKVVVYLSTRPMPTGELRMEETEFWLYHTDSKAAAESVKSDVKSSTEDLLVTLGIVAAGVAGGIFGLLTILGVI